MNVNTRDSLNELSKYWVSILSVNLFSNVLYYFCIYFKRNKRVFTTVFQPTKNL